MDFEKMKAAIIPFGVKANFLNQGPLKRIATAIGESETILFAAMGIDKQSANTVPVILTDKTIYAAKYAGVLVGIDLIVIPLARVGSIESSGGIFATIRIADGTTIHELPNFGVKAAQSFIAATRKAQAISLAAVSIPAASERSAADEIKKYKDLLDAGALTQDEFDAKKKQLLEL